jgi:hypothetical protein
VRRAVLAATIAALVATAGCGGSGAPAPSVSSGSPTPSSAATLPAHTGLVGAIDSARRLSVCENVRLYATTVQGGLPDATDQTFQALTQTMKQPPHEAGLDQLVRRWQRWRAHLGDAETAQRLTAFCAGS